MKQKIKKKIAIILQSRKNSERCKNKMLRKFGNSNLFKIALDKLKKMKSSKNFNIYIAVGEPEFYKILKNYDFKIIHRDKTSVNGQSIDEIWNYFSNIEEDFLLFINPCAPFLKTSTIKKAINKFQSSNIKSLTTVLTKFTWFFNDKFLPINNNSAGNTKKLKPIYECTHSFHIINKKFLLKNGKYWTNKKQDPNLYEVGILESLDIDTEQDFKFIENIYKNMMK